MTTANHAPTFIRRKFTITDTLDEILEDLAEQHYQGNVSLCLRASIEDHRSTLNGTGAEQHALQQLTTQLDDVKNRQETIQSTIEALQNRPEHRDRPSQSHRNIGSMEITEPMQRIYESLASADAGLRMDDLKEQLDIPISQIQPGLGSLVDLGMVVATGGPSPRFRLTGNPLEGGR